jgi:tetratricopeptide (TPR) repeat protein
VLLLAPRNPDAHNLLGIIFDQRNDFLAAEREYRAALRLNPDLISPLANLGVLLARTQRSEAAIRTFETVLKKVPDHPQATINLGIQYAARGDFARALPLLERAARLNVEDYQVRYNLGLALYNLKRFDQAAEVFQSASSLSPSAAEPLYYLGLIHWSRQQDETAAELWERAVQFRPNFPEANFMLGEALRKHRRTAAAVEFYQRALDQDGSILAQYTRLGGAYIVLRQPQQALDVFTRAAKHFPQSPEAHYFVGVAARAGADYDLADREFRLSLTLQPDNVNALAQLGFVLQERDKTVEAERTLRRALAINDKHFYANFDLGRLLVKSRRYEEAIPILRHAALLKPGNPGVHYQLFITFSRLKSKADADKELAIFKQLDEAREARRKQGAEEEDIEDNIPQPD